MLMNKRLVTPLLTLVCTVVLTGCPHTQPPDSTPPTSGPNHGAVPVTVHAPPVGDEADYLREVKVFIEIDRKSHLTATADSDDPNVVCGIPRVFYPPGGTGLESSDEYDQGLTRPRYPARQVRWVARCKNRIENCLKPGERIVIRAKDPDGSDRGCRVEERRFCKELDSSLRRIAEQKKMSFQDFKAKKAYVEDVQQLTLFSAETEGTFVIFGNEGRLRRNQGSITSGIPNRPDFSLSPDLGWHYNIELWKGDKRVDCLDPDVWVEGDGSGGGNQG